MSILIPVKLRLFGMGRKNVAHGMRDLMTDDYINALCDWIEEWQCFLRMFPGYVNDAIDTDNEGCFVPCSV